MFIAYTRIQNWVECRNQQNVDFAIYQLKSMGRKLDMNATKKITIASEFLFSAAGQARRECNKKKTSWVEHRLRIRNDFRIIGPIRNPMHLRIYHHEQSAALCLIFFVFTYLSLLSRWQRFNCRDHVKFVFNRKVHFRIISRNHFFSGMHL
mgnify:CR=1 FL=1